MGRKSFHYDQERFSWSEMFANAETGKTSATGFTGVICIGVGLLGFIASFVFMFLNKRLGEASGEAIYQSIILITIGAALLGVRKLSFSKAGVNAADDYVDKPSTGNSGNNSGNNNNSGGTTTKPKASTAPLEYYDGGSYYDS